MQVQNLVTRDVNRGGTNGMTRRLIISSSERIGRIGG
jgi:hypothetical protein